MSYGEPLSHGGTSRRPRSAGLIIAAVIALIGLGRYMLQTEINPVTGKKQHIAMSVDQERSLGLQAAPGMAKEMGGRVDPRTDRRAALVAEVGRKLVESSNASQSPYADNFHFYLLNDEKTINAFALPGGQIFITRGLFDRLDDESQLAGVLGHEIGHVINRHGAVHMAKGQLGQTLTLAVGVGARDGDDGGRNAQMVAAMVNQMMQLRYGREDESESDGYGLQAMVAAGYDPSGMLGVMRVLQEASKGSRQPEILSSHPLPETRFRDVQDWLKEAYPDGIPRSLSKGRRLRNASDW